MTARRVILLLAICLAPALATAASYEAQVTHVSDGDTVWVRPAHGGRPRPIRIEGIDAPEICQADGPQARDALARQLLRRRVRVDAAGDDDFGRTLARVSLNGQDIGGWQVRHGNAWSYRFRGNAGPYAREERMARQARRGLWRHKAPQEPRAFRISHGPCG